MRKFSWYTIIHPDWHEGEPPLFRLVGPAILPDERTCDIYFKPNRKGGHRHNHIRNARLRGNVCPYCDGIIAKGCGERRYDGVLFCTECAQADYEERCDRAEYLSHIYG